MPVEPKSLTRSLISALHSDSGTGGIAAFRVSAGSNNWSVVDAAGSHVLGPVVPRPSGGDAPVHNVDIDYRPGAGTFSVDVKQLGASTLSHSGNVFPNTKGTIENMDRIGLWCVKTSDDAAFAGFAYMIDGVVAREK